MATSPEQLQYMQEHPEQSLASNIIAANVTGLVIAYIAIALRFYARYKSRLNFAADDWLILAAVLCFTPYTIVGAVGDSGKHIIYVKSIRTYVVTFVAAIVSYALATSLTKFSILVFYCRIFRSKSLKQLALGLSVFIAAYNLATILVTSLMCIPLSSMWTGQPGTCIETVPPFLTLGIVNVLVDVAILTIPVRFVVRLQMSTFQKVQVCGIFLTGTIVCAFGIVRVVTLARAAPGDPSYNQAWSGIWSGCEANVGMVAACLPTLGFFFVKWNSLSMSSSLRSWSRSWFGRFSTTRKGFEDTGSQSDREEKSANPNSHNISGEVATKAVKPRKPDPYGLTFLSTSSRLSVEAPDDAQRHV